MTALLPTTLSNHSDTKHNTKNHKQKHTPHTRNDLATIVSILKAAGTLGNQPGGAAAHGFRGRPRRCGPKVHDRFARHRGQRRIDLALHSIIVQQLSDVHRGVRTILIGVRCEAIQVRTSQAVSIGLTVNELPQGCEVQISVMRDT